MNSPLVSVIITTYKRKFSLVMTAILSVCNQTYANLEIFVIDDTGKENNGRYGIEKGIQKLGDDRIKLIQHDQNLGACAARNTGIVNSNGLYIAFLDDDDEWLPTKIDEQLKGFQVNDEIGLVYCNFYIKTQNTQLQLNAKKILNGFRYKELLYSNFIGSTSFVMISREVLGKCGKFNEQMQSAQDAEYWIRIARSFQVYGIETPLVIYNAHNGPRISNSVDKKIAGLEMFNDLVWDDIKDNRRLLSRRRLVLAPYYAQRNGYIKGLKYGVREYLRYPFSLNSVKLLLRTLLVFSRVS